VRPSAAVIRKLISKEKIVDVIGQSSRERPRNIDATTLIVSGIHVNGCAPLRIWVHDIEGGDSSSDESGARTVRQLHQALGSLAIDMFEFSHG